MAGSEREVVRVMMGGVAQAFGFVGTSKTVVPLSFAHFAKGRSRKCLCKWFDHVTRSRNKIFI